MDVVRRARVARAVVAAAILLAAPPASAGPAETRVVVRFSPQISAPEAQRLASAIRAQLRDTATVATEGKGIAIIDVDRGEGGIALRFVDAEGATMGEPRAITRTGEVGASEAATVVRAFVIAAVEADAQAKAKANADAKANTSADAEVDAKAKPETETAPPPKAEPVPVEPKADAPPRSMAAETREPEPPVVPWRARVGLGYTGATYAPQVPWQSGVRIEGALALPAHLYVGAGYAFHPPTEVDTSLASVRVSRHAAGAFGGIESAGRTWIFGGDAGVGFDAAGRATSRTTAGLARTDDATATSVTFALRGHVRFRVPGGRGVGIDLAPTLELAPATQASVIEEGSANLTPVISPMNSRFRLDVGGTFDGF